MDVQALDAGQCCARQQRQTAVRDEVGEGTENGQGNAPSVGTAAARAAAPTPADCVTCGAMDVREVHRSVVAYLWAAFRVVRDALKWQALPASMERVTDAGANPFLTVPA